MNLSIPFLLFRDSLIAALPVVSVQANNMSHRDNTERRSLYGPGNALLRNLRK